MSEERIVLEWTETDFPSAVVLDSLVHKTMARTEVQCQECHPLHTKDLCCEECLGSDESECDIQDNLAFMVDSPTPMGVPQRALLTLPHGLVVGRSSISGAGLGVLNQGPALPPGMHFGPFEGEECTRDRAIGSFYSWEFLNSKGESEYIDASRDSHSNWMRCCIKYTFYTVYFSVIVYSNSSFLPPSLSRYVNCARNKKEGNLTALQHSGVIFFHCCRSILSGDELLFWPGGQFTDRFEDPSDQIWLRKRTSSELSTDLQYPVFLCHQCQLSFTTESYLERHTKHSHYLDQSLTEPASPFSNDVMEKDHEVSLADCSPNSLTQKGHIQRPMHTVHFKGKLPTNTQKDEASEPPTEATTIQIQVDEASEKPNSCSQCGKIFKQKSHVLRHIRGVHSDVRPYCCPQCNKGFAQKYDLARHQTQVHGKKKKWIRAVAEVRRESRALGRPPSERLRIRRLKSSSTSGANAAQQSPSRTMNSTYSDSTSDALDVEETDGVGGEDQYTCTECQRSYGNPESLEVHHCILSRAKPPFSCSTCGVTFKRYITLKKHKLSKHPKQRLTFGCTHCGRFFSRDAGLQRHLKTEVCKDIQLSSETFTCSDCHYSFTEERHLQKHVRRHHPNEYVAVMCAGLIPPQPNGEKEGCHCVQCGKSYKYVQSFKSHKCFRSAAAKPHLCDKCGKGFSCIKSFKQHQRVHTEEKLHLCDKCGKDFSCIYSLKQHQRVHTGEKPFRCPHCEKAFSHTGQLNVHVRVHTGEKPYLCTECGDSFRQSGDLKRHERKHTGLKPCTCPQCGRSFSRPQSLKAHLLLHNGVRQFRCEQCGKSFSRNYHLTRHYEKMHS